MRIDATSANPKGDADERAVLQRTIEADRCSILDLGSISYRLWNAINAGGEQLRMPGVRQDRSHGLVGTWGSLLRS